MYKDTEDRLKKVEENLAWVLKELKELKEMRTVETHTHYTNIFYSGMDIEEDEPLY